MIKKIFIKDGITTKEGETDSPLVIFATNGKNITIQVTGADEYDENQFTKSELKTMRENPDGAKSIVAKKKVLAVNKK